MLSAQGTELREKSWKLGAGSREREAGKALEAGRGKPEASSYEGKCSGLRAQ